MLRIYEKYCWNSYDTAVVGSMTTKKFSFLSSRVDCAMCSLGSEKYKEEWKMLLEGRKLKEMYWGLL